VNVTGNHSYRPLGHARDSLAPTLLWQALDEELRHTVARLPGSNQVYVLVFGHIREE
jgi:hypothetical protein